MVRIMSARALRLRRSPSSNARAMWLSSPWERRRLRKSSVLFVSLFSHCPSMTWNLSMALIDRVVAEVLFPNDAVEEVMACRDDQQIDRALILVAVRDLLVDVERLDRAAL